MIKSYYAEVDNTIYEKTSSMNTGLDSALELGRYPHLQEFLPLVY